MTQPPRFTAQISLRTAFGSLIGDTRIRLLEAIGRTGSIAQAARQMPLSYKAAWDAVDDMNNLGLHKVILGEVDVFQLSPTDELYAHMNVNYVHLSRLPDFDHYATILDAAAKGDDFISTGEVLLTKTSMTANGEEIQAAVDTSSTFPLRMAEIVWGDGKATHHEQFDLRDTHEFEKHTFSWKANANGWKWARVAVWDVAGGGAFTNPTWR